jgi:hypothetical protein
MNYSINGLSGLFTELSAMQITSITFSFTVNQMLAAIQVWRHGNVYVGYWSTWVAYGSGSSIRKYMLILVKHALNTTGIAPVIFWFKESVSNKHTSGYIVNCICSAFLTALVVIFIVHNVYKSMQVYVYQYIVTCRGVCVNYKTGFWIGWIDLLTSYTFT